MALAKKGTKKATEKLTVSERMGCIVISKVVFKKNTNGNEYISTPFGAVYARIKEVEPGLHCVVKLSNGAIALNDATVEDRMQFLNDQMEKFPNFTIGDIKDMLGL
jgi:hypothetical protein